MAPLYDEVLELATAENIDATEALCAILEKKLADLAKPAAVLKPTVIQTVPAGSKTKTKL